MIKRPHVVALLLVCVLLLPGCGRKPADVDAPPGAVDYTYPPVGP